MSVTTKVRLDLTRKEPQQQ